MGRLISRRRLISRPLHSSPSTGALDTIASLFFLSRLSLGWVAFCRRQRLADSPSLSLKKASGLMPRALSSSAPPTRRPPDGTGKPSRRGAWADSARVASKTQVGSRHRIRPSPRSTGRTCRCSAKPPRLGSSTNSRARRTPRPLGYRTAASRGKSLSSTTRRAAAKPAP